MAFSQFNNCGPCCDCNTFICASGWGIDNNPITSALKLPQSSPPCDSDSYFYTHGPQAFSYTVYNDRGLNAGGGDTFRDPCHSTGIAPFVTGGCSRIFNYEYLNEDGTYGARRDFYLEPIGCYDPIDTPTYSQGRLRVIALKSNGAPVNPPSGMYVDVYRSGSPYTLDYSYMLPKNGELVIAGLLPTTTYRVALSGIGYTPFKYQFNSQTQDLFGLFTVNLPSIVGSVGSVPGVTNPEVLTKVSQVAKCRTTPASLTGVYHCRNDVIPSGTVDTPPIHNCFGCQFISRGYLGAIAGTTVLNDQVNATDPWGSFVLDNGGGSAWLNTRQVDLGDVQGCPLSECHRSYHTVTYQMFCGTDNDGNVTFSLLTSLPYATKHTYVDDFDETLLNCECSGPSGTIILYPLNQGPRDNVCGRAVYSSPGGAVGKCADDYGFHLVNNGHECPEDYPNAGNFGISPSYCPSGNCNIAVYNHPPEWFTLDQWTCRGQTNSPLGGMGVAISATNLGIMNDDDTFGNTQGVNDCVCNRCDDTSEEPACNGEVKEWITFGIVTVAGSAGPFNCDSPELLPPILTFNMTGGAPVGVPDFQVTVTN